MKKRIKHVQKIALMLLFGLIASTGFGASNPAWPFFTFELKNDTRVDARNYEFDVYITHTGDYITPATFELASVQIGVLFNTAIINGGTVSCSIVAGTQTDIPVGQQQTAANMSVIGQKCIKVTGKTTTAGAGAIIKTPAQGGTRVMRIRLTNTVDWASATPNLQIAYSTSGTATYKTIVNAYINSATTNIGYTATGVYPNETFTWYNGTWVTSNLNNPNLAGVVPPTVYNVTGGGNYCSTGTPVNVGIDGSQLTRNYQFYKDGVAFGSAVAGTGSAINIAASGAGAYTCKETTGAGTSMTGTANVTVTSASPVSVSVSPDANNVCAGTTVSFTATPTNGGLTPAYQWKINGNNAGSNSNTLNFNPWNNDVVTCVMTSNASCVSGNPATSNAVTMNVTTGSPASVSIARSANNVCYGTSVDFTATPTNGGTPSYAWKINGDVAGTNSASFSYAPNNGDIVTCEMTSNATCVTGSPTTSNSLTMSVNSSVAASVSIDRSANGVCAGTSVDFTATPINGGTPAYAWKVNGNAMGTNSASFSYTPANNDVVTCVMTSNATCVTGSPATSNSLTMNVNPILAFSFDDNFASFYSGTYCQGVAQNFQVTNVVNGGTPTYYWEVNHVHVGTNSSSYSYVPQNGDGISVVVTSSLSCTNYPSLANGADLTITNNSPVSVSVSPSTNNVCAGTSVDFTATPTNGGSTPAYTWTINNVNAGGINNTLTYVPANGDVVKCVLTSSLACTSGSPATSNGVTMNVNPSLPVSVSIDRSANGVCAGTSVDFTATPTNGGTPAYAWKVNGNAMGTNSASFSYTPANNDVVTCEMTSNAACASGSPATSNSLTMSVNQNLIVSVAIAASTDNVCAGTSITFTATPTNGSIGGPLNGGNNILNPSYPHYQWRVNGSNVGTGASTYTYAPANADAISCIMTSNVNCAVNNPAYSNLIEAHVNPGLPVSVSIGASTNNVLAGTTVDFTATPTNGGVSPVYDWRVNGTHSGNNSASFSYAPANGDVVTCILTSIIACGTGSPATSNAITMNVEAIPAASVAIVASSNPVCSGTTVTYTATPTNGGTTPAYQWKVNGNNVGTDNTSYSFVPVNGDVVTCVMTSNASPVSGSPATSNAVTMLVNSVVSPTVTVTPSANNVLAGTSITYTASAPGFTMATAVWHKNAATTANNLMTFTCTPANLDSVYAVLTFSEACAAASTSNKVLMNVITTAPAVITLAYSNNIQTAVVLNGKVSDNGGDVNVERGFIVSTSTTPTELNGTKVTAASAGAGFYSYSYSGLTPNSLYYYKAYATNPLGTVYGAVNSIDTRNVTTFNGTGLWSDASKWTNGVPTSTSTVFINGTCTAAADGLCYWLGIYANGSLTINTGTTINVANFVHIYSTAASTGALLQNGTLSIANANFNSIEAERFAPGNKSHFVSSPLTDAIAQTFQGSYLNTFNEGTALWMGITSINSPLNIGQGYSIFNAVDKLYKFKGSAFTKGDVTLTSGPAINPLTGFPRVLSFTNATKGSNLVGNPYACNLNGNINTWTKNNVSNSIQVFDPVANTYLTWNGTLGSLPGGLIAENQAFFVKATGVAPSMTIPAASQTLTAATFKSFIPNQLALTVKGNGYSDITHIYFNTGATEGTDNQFDVEKMFGPDETPQLFTTTSDNVLSINCLPEVNENVVVPMGLRVGANTSYTITASDLESFNAGTQVYLEDLKLGKMINLTEQNAYTFEATTTDNVNRFKVHFGNASTTTSSTAINAYAFENTVYVNNPSLVKINEVVIYNALGQVVTSFKPEISTLAKYNVNLASGSYIVKMVTDNNVVSNKVNLK